MSFTKGCLMLFGILIGYSLAQTINLQFGTDMSPIMADICKVIGAVFGGFIGIKLIKFFLISR